MNYVSSTSLCNVCEKQVRVLQTNVWLVSKQARRVVAYEGKSRDNKHLAWRWRCEEALREEAGSRKGEVWWEKGENSEIVSGVRWSYVVLVAQREKFLTVKWLGWACHCTKPNK